MWEKIFKFAKWFSFAFLLFSFLKSFIPDNIDYSFMDGGLAGIQAFFSLQWLVQFQVLICFSIAFAGILILANMIREQLAQDRKKKDDQLRGKRAAALAGLPFTLNSASNYVKASSKILIELHDRCQGEVLPKWVEMPPVPPLDKSVLDALKDNIEHFSESRSFLSTLVASLQIQNGRLTELATAHANKREMVLRINIEIYLKETAEISAQLALLVEYLRKGGGRLPRKIRNRDIGHALITLISDDQISIPIIDKYQLTSDDIWVPGYLKM